MIDVQQLQAPICTQAVQQWLLLEQYRRQGKEGGREEGRVREVGFY